MSGDLTGLCLYILPQQPQVCSRSISRQAVDQPFYVYQIFDFARIQLFCTTVAPSQANAHG